MPTHFYCQGTLDAHIILNTFIAAVRAIGVAATLAAAGLWFARRGLMTPALSKGLSHLSVTLAIPALLFSSMVPGFSIELLEYAWPMFLLPAIYILVGTFIGFLVLIIVQPPADFRFGTVAACAFGNTTGIPVILLSVLQQSLSHSVYADIADPLLFLSLMLVTQPLMQWLAGLALLVLLKGDLSADDPAMPSPALSGTLSTWLRDLCRCFSGEGTDADVYRSMDLGGGLANLPYVASTDADVYRSMYQSSGNRYMGSMELPSSEPSLTSAEEFLRTTATDSLLHPMRKQSRAEESTNCISMMSQGEDEFLPPIGLRAADLRAGETTRRSPASTPARSHTSSVADVLEYEPNSLSPRLRLAQVPSRSQSHSYADMVSSLVPGEDTRRRVLSGCWRTTELLLRRLLVPQVVAILAGGFVGLFGRQFVLPPETAPLGWLYLGVTKLGAAAVPINLILLGAALSRTPERGQLPLATAAGIVIARMLVMPVCGLGIARLLSALHLPVPYMMADPFWLVCLVLTCTPTANNIVVMCELAGENRRSMSATIFYQYCAAPLLLPGVLTLFIAFICNSHITR